MSADTLTHQGRPIALPGVCARVFLPMPANFLRTPEGGTLDLAELTDGDAVLLGLALGRQTVSHWRDKWLAAQRLNAREAEEIAEPSLVHPAIAEKVARDFYEASTGLKWHLATDATRATGLASVTTLLTLFLEEIARG